MTNVITLPIRRRPSPVAAADTGEARILLFTGVRYVRDEAEPTAPSPQPAPLLLAEDRLQA